MDRQQIQQMVAAVSSCSASSNALEREGFPPGYAGAFQSVALQQKCVISTRTPGRSCMGLLREGYDAKSFHIKGKSCNWGPMAGFVCLDPMLNKKGVQIEDGKSAAERNLSAHQHSLADAYEDGKMATATQVIISDARLSWLMTNGYLTNLIRRDNQGEGTASGGGVTINYRLARTNIDSGVGWAVYYDRTSLYNTEHGRTLAQNRNFGVINEAQGNAVVDGYAPLLAMVNPHAPYEAATSLYKNAITGDFDLFAVWPYTGRGSNYNAGEDERMAGMTLNRNVDNPVRDMQQRIFRDEHAQLGNISERIFMIGQLLNSSISAFIPGRVKPNRVFHSDEGGRPGATALELPVAAFIPGHRNGYLLHTPVLMKHFAMYCKRAGYKIFANIGWFRELGENVVSESAQIRNLRGNIPRPPQH